MTRNFLNRHTQNLSPPLRALVLTAVACASVAASACGPSDDQEPVPIHDGARLTWDQQASSVSQVRALTFRLYVDGNVSSLQSVACNDVSAAAGFTCSGTLPPMGPGRHVLELSSVLDGQESARSARFIVSLSSTSAVSSAPGVSDSSQLADASETVCSTQSRSCYDAQVVASMLASATIFAAARDGRVFFIEHEQQVRIISDGVLIAEPALVASRGSRIVGIAVDDHGDAARSIFVAWTENARPAGTVVNITRFREFRNVLGEGAQIATGLPFKDGAFAPLAVGSDGLIYIALPASTDQSSAGVVMRITRDGLAPPGSAAASPSYVINSRWPTSLSVEASGGIWAGGRTSDDAIEIAKIDESRPIRTALTMDLLRSLDQDVAIPDPVLSAGTDGSVLIASNGRLFRGLTSNDGRLTLDEISVGNGAKVQAVVQSADGSIYVSITAPDQAGGTVLRLRQP